MKDLQKILTDILDRGYLMSLGITDDGGVWVSDVIFVNEGFKIYWISSESARHSKAIEKNPKVAATITLSNKSGEKNIGIQIMGTAKKIEGDVFELAKKHRIKRGKPAPTKAGEILDPDEFWYELTPTKIDIINEPLWGFDKKSLELK